MASVFSNSLRYFVSCLRLSAAIASLNFFCWSGVKPSGGLTSSTLSGLAGGGVAPFLSFVAGSQRARLVPIVHEHDQFFL